jgi:hypothetical protein
MLARRETNDLQMLATLYSPFPPEIRPLMMAFIAVAIAVYLLRTFRT